MAVSAVDRAFAVLEELASHPGGLALSAIGDGMSVITERTISSRWRIPQMKSTTQTTAITGRSCGKLQVKDHNPGAVLMP